MSSQKQSYPRVGVGVVLFCVQTGEILVGKRKGSHGSGQWALPGGALEWKETSSSCAKRELREETGIDLNEVWHEEVHDSLDDTSEIGDDMSRFATYSPAVSPATNIAVMTTLELPRVILIPPLNLLITATRAHLGAPA